MSQEIRWQQRFSNYVKALEKLKQSVEYIRHDLLPDEDAESEAEGETLDAVLNEMIKEGLIQRFEYTHELAWNTMKDYADYQGIQNIGGSRDATREAFQMNLIKDAHVWMEMIKSRNLTTHTYNKDVADDIYVKILRQYFSAFLDFESIMEEKRSGNQLDIFES
jgi:nucleotidyltransferase substrate binding protein (TIGR01987 family)